MVILFDVQAETEADAEANLHAGGRERFKKRCWGEREVFFFAFFAFVLFDSIRFDSIQRQ